MLTARSWLPAGKKQAGGRVAMNCQQLAEAQCFGIFQAGSAVDNQETENPGELSVPYFLCGRWVWFLHLEHLPDKNCPLCKTR